MRKLILSFVLATAGAVGLTAAEPARAYDDGRIFVSIGDVSFSYGQPYHRHSRVPLYVVHESWGPRYYYTQPQYYASQPRYYAPRYSPPRVYYGGGYRYHDRHDRRHDRRDDRHDRRWGDDDHRGRDRGHDRDRGRGHR